MKRFIGITATLFMLSTTAAQAADPEFITVGGGRGTFPIMAAKVAEVINKEFPGVTASSIPGGSDLNLKNIQNGVAQLGLSISMTTYQAVNGEAHFTQKYDKVRHVMSLYRGYAHFAAPARNDVQAFEDLIKKPYKVYFGKVGTLHHVLMGAMLNAYGVTEEAVKSAGGIPQPVAYSDVVRMVQDGQLDVAMLTGPIPYGFAMELAQSPGIRLLNPPAEAIGKVTKALPGIGSAVIPKGSYQGQTEDVRTIAYMSELVASSDLSDDFVYRLVGALVKHMPEMKDMFAGAAEISLETALLDNAVAVHPGAQRYYDEKGIK